MSEAKKWIIILIGPPGAGKGTQAELLAEDFGLFNFETSKIIEEKFKTDPSLAHEKEQFDAGKLVDAGLVLKWNLSKIDELAAQGQGIVFSGSPRTSSEAKGEFPDFEKLYGRENIKVINIEVSEAESIKRNSARRLCKANRHPIPDFPEYKGITVCPKDGSEIITRTLDTPETIKVRYATYLEETKPILELIRQKGYKVLEINGDQTIELVHDEIINRMHELHHSDHADILTQS